MSATCEWCNQEMLPGVACAGNLVVDYPDGVSLPSLPNDGSHGNPCHDCNAPLGGAHHPGCDNERCHRCSGQLIGCGCLSGPEEEDE